MDINKYLEKQSAKINKVLGSFLPGKGAHPSTLHEAMRYAVLSGGKRIRPILALEACRVVGGDTRKVLPAACALELIHNYSLTHDDLPCMDNDKERRGRAACHMKFGEDIALLVGDALLTLAFKVLCSKNGVRSALDLERQMNAARLVAEAVGSEGMVGGQAVDMEFQDKDMDLATAEYINVHKSGALIAVALRVGATLGGGSEKQVQALYRYGKYVGLLFQIVDDIMDRQGYAKVIGVSEAKKEAEALLGKAKAEITPFGRRTAVLEAIADFVLTRDK